jgi:hypothetical protein
MVHYTREDAARLIDESEGQVIDSSKPHLQGHAHAHVGSSETPALDLPSRRKLTTMYRNRTQAEKDLRDLLNRYVPQLAVLANGGEINLSCRVSQPRQVYIAKPVGAEYSYAGESVKSITRQELFVKIVKDVTGALHLRTMYLKG